MDSAHAQEVADENSAHNETVYHNTTTSTQAALETMRSYEKDKKVGLCLQYFLNLFYTKMYWEYSK